jgi:ABC-type lipoprotein release transport system permease subunit|tara:strand:+ start:102 stop:416 length:315 start_codon:yes stop_codon:yes gene_type:complete
MKKMLLILSIFLLIVVTALIKNSTKKIEDQIFAINENIRVLNAHLEDVLLEYNYLSSPKKLLQYQSQYFENDLIQMNIANFKVISEKGNQVIIKNFTLNSENND